MKIEPQPKENEHQIVIALGDPAGIGMEITLKALADPSVAKRMNPVIVGCRKSLEVKYKQLISKGNFQLANPTTLNIQDVPLTQSIKSGEPSPFTGEASFNWLTRATEFLIKNNSKALVTAPISKYAWSQAGHIYSGQTERLAELTWSKNVSMLFTAISPESGWRFNTLLATSHIPLSKVPTQLTPQLITSKLNTLFAFCKQFKRNPKIAIAGLNPHSGEQGQLGNEEILWLNPTVKTWKKNHPEAKVDGPLPPDICWLSAAKAWKKTSTLEVPDGYLALYHDQGLIPMKLLAFDEAVNTTMGLPFLRTSPDHGTAFDIADQGTANPSSMIAALQAALDLNVIPSLKI